MNILSKIGKDEARRCLEGTHNMKCLYPKKGLKNNIRFIMNNIRLCCKKLEKDQIKTKISRRKKLTTDRLNTKVDKQ